MNLFFTVALLVITASAANATDIGTKFCTEDLSEHDYRLLQELYAYSLFIEAADKGELPPWSCCSTAEELIGNPPGWNSTGFEIQHLTKDEFLGDDGWKEIVDSFRKKGQYVVAYNLNGSGPTHIVCDKNLSNIKVFLTWSRLRPNIDDDRFLRDIIVPLVTVVDIGAGAMIGEGLRTATFQRDDDLFHGEHDYYPEKVTVIPGTDITKLHEWNASLKDLKEKSCAFDFMVAIAAKAWSNTDRMYAFAGHSLGGSIAQYVAQKLDTPLIEESSISARTKANFQIYAFNAIGLDESRGNNPANLYSFYIEGDPVVDLGAVYKGRIQGGRVVKYTPLPSETTGVINTVRNLLSESPFKWHRLSGVQTGLCDCMNGRGQLNIGN